MGRPSTFRTLGILAVAFTAITVGLVAEARAGDPHVVEPGETLSEIAERHGANTSELAALNSIANPNRIYPGTVLQIGGGTYRVRVGDSLWIIARRYGVTVSDLTRLNRIGDPSKIFPGMELNIGAAPGRTYTNLPSDIAGSPTRRAYIPIFEKWGDEYGVDPAIVMAVGYTESNWVVNARPPIVDGKRLSSAYGVGQILTGTADWINRALIPGPVIDRTTAAGNIRLMSKYLAWLIETMGTEELGIGSYYQGLGSVGQDGFRSETRVYVDRVERRRALFS